MGLQIGVPYVAIILNILLNFPAYTQRYSGNITEFAHVFYLRLLCSIVNQELLFPLLSGSRRVILTTKFIGVLPA